MGLQDLPYVAGVHSHHFPHGFFARLGRRFLTRYYRTFLDGPSATALVAEVDGEVTGFLAGVLAGPQHRHLVLKHHGAALACAAVIGMARHPAVAVTFLSTRVRRYASSLARHRKGVPHAPLGSESLAVLTHMVVTQRQRRRGIGTELVNRFLVEAYEAGCTRACLVTLDGPQGAGPFYERLQWRRTATTTQRDGRDLLHYELTFGTEPPVAQDRGEERNA